LDIAVVVPRNAQHNNSNIQIFEFPY